MTETVITNRIDGVTSEEDKNYFFSKAEIDFLRGMKAVGSNYERVLLHRIFKKTRLFQDRDSTSSSKKLANVIVGRKNYGKL